ncbi:AMP-dependent synthetase [Sulfolobus sp. A20]|uniref:long-chain-fatty-acid--CoA ligase n=1 Tax=Saccharolobus sp. A20 TaxID=1891280 RepID=UPI000845E83D|nr:long-chain-fatty-acid--CoA ligase [Sulfolobus sp. A20]TRM75318.1 AMP-dependent synthetase [Sulfolobus sp. A20-N-F8]TRM76150.1 AMP-dependent synthetase [Sulfolobus sp. E5]TRM77277.1 AMP-dependent synthetase [Sulfolobus sp. B5]TRM82781.1 AMP-dependent synthetase [Sulfolobus sp. A20-N-F6]TRM89526.1 AMP-dependent synthetase [Sulfolobus sp. C3]TRM98935.1 AMP-dependent synthetase [Sulfolobus sp. E1]TRN00125.1 AMP-dependent synthetase [Sulfolobus sp. F1]
MMGKIYDYQLTIDKIIEWSSYAYPDQEIVYAPPKIPKVRLTYSKLNDRAKRMASVIQNDFKIKIGDKDNLGTRIGVMDWNTIRFLELYYAIPMTGAVMHTVNVRLSPEEMAYTINLAEDEIIFTNEDFIPILSSLLPKLPTVKKVVVMSDKNEDIDVKLPNVEVYEYEKLIREGNPNYIPPELNENTIATIVFTSGTTGLPKGAYFRHRDIVLHSIVVNAGVWTGPPLNLTSKDVWLQIPPLFHVHGWGSPYSSLLLGMKSVYPGRYDWNHIIRIIKEEGVTYTAGVPTMLYLIINSPEMANYDLRGFKFIVAGQAIPRGLYEEAKRRGILVCQGMGMTETAPLMGGLTFKPKMENWSEEKKEEYILYRAGRSAPFVFVRVVDPEMNDVPKDGKTIGEIVVRAPWMTRGYYKDPKKTEESWTEDGWFRTGDLAIWDEEGYLAYVDRVKDVIKSGGEWIPSTKLEDLISTHPGVAEVAVIAAKHEKWVERPIAIITPKQEYKGKLTENDIIQHLTGFVNQGVIPKWWIPDKIIIWEEGELPKTSTAKIDKKVLRDRFSNILVQK